MAEALQPLYHFLVENCQMVIPISLIICSSYYFLAVVHKPRVVCRSTTFNQFIDNHLTILKRSYWPTPWLLNNHQQTILRILLQRNPKFAYTRSTIVYIEYLNFRHFITSATITTYYYVYQYYFALLSLPQYVYITNKIDIYIA